MKRLKINLVANRLFQYQFLKRTLKLFFPLLHKFYLCTAQVVDDE